ncbi:hypothetical protein EKO04_008033 [Ascochyta lentis]|uniref:Uncharacterized protein n=1 Tax=Ascochyta lentis TaxID=205686 RepID=A0A8H7IXY1_9PLEO|nr:hypothetical protein EKO04_008033 [Ascochyta lentis]
MKSFKYLSYALLAFTSLTEAHPGMGDAMAAKRAESKQLLGDLKTLKDGQLTPVGKDIKPFSSTNCTPSPAPSTPRSQRHRSMQSRRMPRVDLNQLRTEMKTQLHFRGTQQLRPAGNQLGYHDAGVWSSTSADGSMLLAT